MGACLFNELFRAITTRLASMPRLMGRLLTFGEIMLRLSPPGRELAFQSPRFDAWLAGAEANVATQLAVLGHDVAMVSRVPDNDLGRWAVNTLRGYGVDTSGIMVGGERLGICFVTNGAGVRATDVVYDRAGSSFADAACDLWDWDSLLQGVDRLHLSGITPALGPGASASALAAVEAATARGIAISFDGNWRGKLWARWDGDPRGTLTALISHADMLFGNHRDIALLLGQEFDGNTESRRRAAADAAFLAFPKLQFIASTARHVESVNRHWLSARVDARTVHAQTPEILVEGIVDRIGAGDAFAAGVLHGFARGADLDAMAASGLALSALKHSLPGDAGLFEQTAIDAYFEGKFDVMR